MVSGTVESYRAALLLIISILTGKAARKKERKKVILFAGFCCLDNNIDVCLASAFSQSFPPRHYNNDTYISNNNIDGA